MKASLASILACSASAALAATSAEWRSKSIYQVLTDRFSLANGSTTAPCNAGEGVYCGGTFQGTLKNLDYIAGLGFTAIWISPVTYQVQRRTSDLESYHGYWQNDIYELNPEFGTEDDLRALSSRLHDRGMFLMIDIVLNDFAWAGNSSSIDYSSFNPFNDEKYFHPFCNATSSTNENETQAQNCWIGDSVISLPDLKTEDPAVASMLTSWAQSMIANYSIDGFRIDSVLNLNQGLLEPFNNASAIFNIGEVYDGNPVVACPYQQHLDSILNYPLYFPLIRAFANTTGSITDLVEMIASVKEDCRDVSVLGTFSENHDQPRFASLTPDMSLAKNLIAFTILADGIPILYEGQEQHYNGSFNPLNREAIWLSDYNTKAPLYTTTSSLNAIRTHAISTNDSYLDYVQLPLHNDSNTLVLRKGFDGNQLVTVLNNNGANAGNYTVSVGGTGFQPGEPVMDVLSCNVVLVDSAGNLTVTVEAGLPQVLYNATQLNGSGVCEANVGITHNTTSDKPKSSGASGRPHTPMLVMFGTILLVMSSMASYDF